jgi:ubiquinone/menaquinone biosynthesis C-methylase UbiE
MRPEVRPTTPTNTTAPTEEQLRAGQAIYTRPILALYDWSVLGISNRFIWKCPTPTLLEMYRRHITANHLEVGVGTGYFLDHCRFPTPAPRLVLLDLNQNCLDVTAKRLSRYRPERIKANILETIPYRGEPFDSLGINYVLHCLPGTMRTKAAAFQHLSALLRPGGVLFGSTLLSRGVKIGFLARQLMRRYNALEFFCNWEDSLDDLTGILNEQFADASVRAVGCAALFVARK